MFARTSWKEFVTRILLTVVILFNAVVPTASVAAKAVEAQNDSVSSETQTAGRRSESGIFRQTFARPTSRVNEVIRSQEEEGGVVLLQCNPGSSTQPGGSPICPGESPSIALTETFSKDEGIAWFAGGDVRFKLLCEGGNCEPPNIYYRATFNASFYDRWGAIQDWSLALYTFGHFMSDVTEGNTGSVCAASVSSGSCTHSISGMFPKELISTNSDLWGNYYIDFHASLSSPVSWTNKYTNGVVEVSLTPFGDPVPEDSANCKEGCDYSQAQGFAADPINTYSGALSYKEDDLEIQTGAGPLSFRRTYVSSYIERFSSPLGYGWVHNQDMRLLFPTPEDPEFVRFKDSSGNVYLFRETGTDLYIPYSGNTAVLIKNTGAPVTYTLKDKDQNTYTFDADGKLTALTDPTGQVISYTYDGSGRLERVSADGGTCFFDFAYTPQGQLESVTDHSGRSASFGYDATSGDLISYTDVMDRTWHYQYQNHLLTHVRDHNLALVERNEYYANGKVQKQFNGNDKLVAELTYNANGTRVITDALGNTITHTYNSNGALVKVTNYFGAVQKRYNDNFRPIWLQDAVKNPPTQLTWSANGVNLESITDALNNKTSLYYNSYNKPTRMVDALGRETRIFYEDPDFPTLPTRIEYPLSFDGGATYTGVTYEYYPPSSGASAGKVKFVTEGARPPIYYTYTSTGQVESMTIAHGTASALTTTYAYDSLGRLIEVTDEQGLVTHSEYDDAGRLLKTTSNYVAARPQNDENKYNLVTEYRYDTRGNQIAVIDTYGVITRTYYDLANHPVTMVQNLAGQTIEAASPPGRGGAARRPTRISARISSTITPAI